MNSEAALPRVEAGRRTGRNTARRWVADIHAWLGAAVGLFMVLVGATGAALGFAYELMRAETGGFDVTGPMPDGPAPVGDYVARTQALAGPDFIPLGYIGPHGEIVNPAPMIYGLSAPSEAGGVETVATIDPGTGEVTAVFPLYDTWTHWLIDLHYELLAGPIGAILMAAIALLLTALAVAGLYLWWPVKRSVIHKMRTFKWHGNTFRKAFSLHSFAGFWLALPIIAWSLSGAYWSQPEWFPQGITPQLDPPPQKSIVRLEAASCGKPASPQDAVNIAATRFPNATIAEMHFAAPWQAWQSVHLHNRSGDRLDGDTRLWVAAGCADIAENATLSGMEAAGPFLKALHGGRVFGPLRQVIILMIGVAFVLLGITGLMLWWRRISSSRHVRKTNTETI